jgi:hypothetical protein
MKKFLVLYRAPLTSWDKAKAAQASMTPEQGKEMMAKWQAWIGGAKSSLVDLGQPAGKSVRVTPGGVVAERNDLGGYSIMQAESKEQLGETLKNHPHFHSMKDGSIDVVELMPVPGM